MPIKAQDVQKVLLPLLPLHVFICLGSAESEVAFLLINTKTLMTLICKDQVLQGTIAPKALCNSKTVVSNISFSYGTFVSLWY